MARALSTWLRAKRDGDPPGPKPLSGPERRSLQLLRREAREVGSYLSSGGKGGLSPSLVRTVMRRDGYTCKVCGELGDRDGNGGIGVHHKGGVVASAWLSKKGHSNHPNNIVTICDRCHDRVHQRARADGVDSSQVEPEGDGDGDAAEVQAG